MAWVGATDAEEARANLRASLRGPLPSVLERGDLPERATALPTYVWEETVRPDWERRRRVMEADMAARTARVNQDDWAAVLDSLKPGTRWLGESRFQVNHNAYPPQELAAGAQLLFMPVTPRTSWVSWEGRERYAVVYPCLGALSEDDVRRPAPDGLGALIVTVRAGLLTLLGTPMSTTQLVAVTGRALGSVGGLLGEGGRKGDGTDTGRALWTFDDEAFGARLGVGAADETVRASRSMSRRWRVAGSPKRSAQNAARRISARQWGGTASARRYTSGTERNGRSVCVTDPAPLNRHGLCSISPSSTAVCRISPARRTWYAWRRSPRTRTTGTSA